MKLFFILAIVTVVTIGSAAAQSSTTSSAKHLPPSRDKGMAPITSPDPVTMIALAGGSAAVIGLANRRRKKK